MKKMESQQHERKKLGRNKFICDVFFVYEFSIHIFFHTYMYIFLHTGGDSSEWCRYVHTAHSVHSNYMNTVI